MTPELERVFDESLHSPEAEGDSALFKTEEDSALFKAETSSNTGSSSPYTSSSHHPFTDAFKGGPGARILVTSEVKTTNEHDPFSLSSSVREERRGGWSSGWSWRLSSSPYQRGALDSGEALWNSFELDDAGEVQFMFPLQNNRRRDEGAMAILRPPTNQSGCRDEGTTGFLQTAQKCENHRDWMLVLAPEKEFTQEWSEEWSGRNVGRDNIAS
ncbi:hypothetical protein F4821DRAFT_259593 [Hypoxylon rubiginosum]|uniref:Uncharacterized protein n=1 Tax=Hypoxylon rubiginosum TaxID=110542 RepID=A0ACC0D285_9PEZI|nr:hypothetical protein F4821DRAFT_259593 [Hypoxylon rubiginosum]